MTFWGFLRVTNGTHICGHLPHVKTLINAQTVKLLRYICVIRTQNLI